METPTPPVLREEPLERKRPPENSRLRDFPEISRWMRLQKLLGDKLANEQRLSTTTVTLSDKFGRAITDLRISITDRCNYKCVYCRTGNEGALYGDLPFADYLRMARIFAGLGIKKIRLTGGEPLLRNGVIEFVRELAKLRSTTEKNSILR